jgi:hypothetical protein
MNNPKDETIMEKETVVKDDGRRLIYYRFVPASPAAPAEASPRAPREEG